MDGVEMNDLCQLSAVQAASLIREGQVSSEELVQACLARIEATDGAVHAWAQIEPGYVLEQARQSDKHRRSGAPIGPLHGVPVGVKDIFDTFDFLTQMGTSVHDGRKTVEDATAVARLRQAGAVIMGKTVTAEFAVLHPGPTTNPHDATRTPGGSSSGSAAAVASAMVPLALGTQTNGSVIRPASYCGVIGYKPTFGLISRHRVLRTSKNLDHVGLFARTLEDAALMAECMIGFDQMDSDTSILPKPDLLDKVDEEPPMPPRFAFVKGPAWDHCDTATHEAFAELVDALGDRVEEVPIGSVYDEVFSWQRTLMEADIAKNLGPLYDQRKDAFSDVLAGIIERGRAVHAVDYALALDRQDLFALGLNGVFEDFDAIITPAATGEAPIGLDSTGNPACATLASFTGMPSISLPLLSGEAGMPMGVQLISHRGDDARLFRNASWLIKHLQDIAD